MSEAKASPGYKTSGFKMTILPVTSQKKSDREDRGKRGSVLIPFVVGWLLGVGLVVLVTALQDGDRTLCGLPQMRGHFRLGTSQPSASESEAQSGETTPQHTQEEEKKFLLIAVMTARKNLDTRVAAIHRTWGQHVPGDIRYFVGSGPPYRGQLPVVQLEGVEDNEYPPQRKSLAMLQYMHRHYGHRFHWFMRADDDVYVKPLKLERFLRSVNNSRHLYVGQPGFGVVSEKGRLGLLDNKAFCMGGPGILLSPQTLEAVAKKIPDCLKDIVTPHEDTEVGRCVQKSGDIQCTLSYQWKELFYQLREDTDFFGPAKEAALTLHAYKDSPQVYLVHAHHQLSLQRGLERRIASLQSQVEEMEALIAEKGTPRATAGPPTPPVPSLAEERGRHWDFLRYHTMYALHDDNLTPVRPFTQRGHGHAYLLANLTAHQDPDVQRRLRGSNPSPAWAWQQRSPSLGLRHKLSYLPKKGPPLAVETVQPFRPLELRDEDLSRALKTPIFIVLPLFKRSPNFLRFLASVNASMADFNSSVHVRVMLYPDEEKEHTVNAAMAESYRKWWLSAPYVEVLWPEETVSNGTRTVSHEPRRVPRLAVQVVWMEGGFSRAIARQQGLLATPPGGLMLMMDVDVVLRAGFLRRVQLHTVAGRQVYGPIIFTQYDPRGACRGPPGTPCPPGGHFDLSQDAGTWRYFGFGIYSMFRDDKALVGDYDTSIEGWGNEDTDYYNKIVASPLSLFRAPDPDIVHVFHPRDCDVTLPPEQMRMCLMSRDALYGSMEVMAKLAEQVDGSDVNGTKVAKH